MSGNASPWKHGVIVERFGLGFNGQRTNDVGGSACYSLMRLFRAKIKNEISLSRLSPVVGLCVVRFWQVAFVDEVSICFLVLSPSSAPFRWTKRLAINFPFSVFHFQIKNTFSWRQTIYQASTSSHKVQSISVKTKYRIFQLNSIYLHRKHTYLHHRDLPLT